MKDKIKKNIKYVVAGAVLLIIIVFAYNYLNGSDEPVGVQEVVYQNDTDQEAQEILEMLDEVLKINIRSEFFNDNMVSYSDGNLLPFSQLNDFSSADLPSKEFGKSNPFLVGSFLGVSDGTSPFSDSSEGENTDGEITSEQEGGFVEESVQPQPENTQEAGSNSDLTEDERAVINQ